MRGRMLGAVYLRLYWAFLCCACALGLCLAFVQPIFSAPDEPAHWIASHVRAEQALGTSGCVPTIHPIPWNERKWLFSYEKSPGLPLHCVPSVSLYGDLLTYPGVLISKLVLRGQRDSVLAQLEGIVLSRLLQGALFILCLTRVGLLARAGSARVGPLGLVGFALSPLLAQQAFAVSSDGVQLCFAVCLFSAIVFWERLQWPDLVLFVLTGWGAAAKPVVVVLIIPSVLLGYWYAQLRVGPPISGRAAVKGLLAALKPTWRPPVQTLTLWAAAGLVLLTVLFAARESTNGNIADATGQLDAGAQLALLSKHPLWIVRFLYELKPSPLRIVSYLGKLGWLNVKLGGSSIKLFKRAFGAAVAGECAVLMLYGWTRRRAVIASARQVLAPALFGCAAAVFNLMVLATIFYLVWTPVGAAHVEGFQIRYAFPSAIVFLASLFAALGVALGGPTTAHAESPAGELSTVLPRAALPSLLVLAPLAVLALVVPYVASVFLDLAQAYYTQP